MAAPIGAYRNKSLFMNKSGVDYEHLTAILQEGDQVMKERFYLDELFVLRLEDGTDGVIGMVAEGSANEAMHNLTTRGGVGRAYKGGRVVRMLNDAGLNTLGTGYVNSVEYRWATDMGLNNSYFASYYNSTSNVGIRYKLATGSIWTTIMFDRGMSQQQSITDLFEFPITGRNTGDVIEVQPININEEGVFYGSSTNIILGAVLGRLTLLKRSVACDPTGQVSIEVYFDSENFYNNIGNVTESSTGSDIFLYINKKMSTPTGSGWYFGILPDKSYYVDANGEIIFYSNCQIPTVTLENQIDGQGRYQFRLSLSNTYYKNIVLTARVDTSPIQTPNYYPIQVTVQQGQMIGAWTSPLELEEPWKQHNVYDAVVTDNLPLIIEPM